LALWATWPEQPLYRTAPGLTFVKYKATDATRLRLPGAFVPGGCFCDGDCGLPWAQTCWSYSSEYPAVLTLWTAPESQPPFACSAQHYRDDPARGLYVQ